MSIILLLHLFMSTFTFGHVELLTVDYHSIDIPIVELNNHTLREVFDGGNINNDIWTFLIESRDGITQNNSYLKVTNISGLTANNLGARQTQSILGGNKYYVRISNYQTNINFTVDSGMRLVFIDNVQLININTSSGNIITPTGNNSYYQIRADYSGGILSNDYWQFDDLYFINQTLLGINSLTVEQMDTYFEMYQENMLADDVTYVKNEMTITDLTYILGFSFVWVVIIWTIRKVVL